MTRQTQSQGKKRASYFVYMLLCDDGSYYTGYTSNVLSRFERHMKGHGARYTKMRRPSKIAYLKRFATRRAAMRTERQIKMLSHNQKEGLVRRSKPRTVAIGAASPFE
jgi:putative endonuclease